MKKIVEGIPVLVVVFIFYFFSFSAHGQNFSPDYFRNLKVNELSKDDVVSINAEMQKQGISIESMEKTAITNGMSAIDFATLKSKLDQLNPTQVVESKTVEMGTVINEQPIEMDSKPNIYGAEIFNNSSLSFEPNSNMPTPANYTLGVGDEILIVIYGMQEFSTTSSVSKEGKITIPLVGQLTVNGLSFEAAKSMIKKACAKIYSSLGSGQSNISITLTKIKTIRVTIIGANKPGNYSVSSLSTVFNALHVAGGPEGNGSYRNIELIRNNKVIRKIDIYKFLIKGDQSDNVNLMDNDVIRIPVYENRVKIEGHVKKPGIFELLPNETFSDLMIYCGGFDEAAYRNNIKLVQNSDKGLKILDLTEKDYINYLPQLGDIFKVSELLSNFENKISIKGSVYRPDDYEFKEGLTIKELVEKANGLTPDAYRSRALLIREKVDLTKEIMTVDLNSIYNGGQDLTLRKNDELIISSIFDFKNQKSVSISGQIKKSGDYPYIENLRLYDLIMQAGGFLEGSSKVVEISSIIIKDEVIRDQVENSIVKTFEIDTLLLDQSKNVLLSPYDNVQIRHKPVFETQKTVSIEGQVIYPGSYVVANKKERFSDIVNRSGGLKVDANIDAISVFRNGKMIPINYKRAIRSTSSNSNIFIKPGDQIVVNKLQNTVTVNGLVFLNTEVPFVNGRGVKYYTNAVGGLVENADKRKIYVVKPNGIAKSTKSFLFFKKYPKVEPGSEVVVPMKVEKIKSGKLSTSELAIIGSAITGMTTSIFAIISLITK